MVYARSHVRTIERHIQEGSLDRVSSERAARCRLMSMAVLEVKQVHLAICVYLIFYT